MFNEASSNIDVGTSSKGVEMNAVDPDGVEITNRSFSMKKLKEKKSSLEYGKFLKSATLLANVEEERDDVVRTDDIEIKSIETLTDEQLFKICGGRTAHKSARHGLKLEGKLQRIAEQEKKLLEKMRNSKNNGKDIFNSSHETSKEELQVDDDTDYSKPKSKSKRKREKQKELELVSKISSMELSLNPETKVEADYEEDEAEIVTKKKKRKRKHKFDEDGDVKIPEKREKNPVDKPKRIKLDESVESSDHELKIETINSITSTDGTKKKKKKSKRQKEKKKTKNVIEDLEKKFHL